MDEEAPPYAIVVDDNETVLFAALDILEDAGFRTLMARNANEAIAEFEAYGAQITLLFTDVEMPGELDGFALARLVAARWPEVGILAASGNRKPDEGDLPPGATFVTKPFSADVVHERVHSLLPAHRKPKPLRNRMG